MKYHSMQKLSVSVVLFALCMRISTAQTGYNYDNPALGGQGGRPTTPTYQAPSFPPSQSAPGGGYNYPPQDDFSTPTGGASYPAAGQRPTAPGQFGGVPSSAGAPYPSAGPTGGASYPTGQQGGRPIQGSQPGFVGVQTAVSSPGVSSGFVPGGPGVAANIPGTGSAGGSSPSVQNDDAQEGDYSAIPGEPEVDYPIYSEIPETSFDCNQQQYPGYYADTEARCQVFHICALNKTFNFLCPNGTIFSQETLVCVWWNQFDCNSAPSLFGNNANLYAEPAQGQGQGAQGGQGGQTGPGIGGGNVGAQNDFTAPTGGAGPYPAPGRPQAPTTSFGSTAPAAPYPSGPSTSYQPTGGSTGGPYPTGPSTGGYPSTPYPSAGAPSLPNVPNVPSPSYQPPQGFPSQADAPYPASGSPNRDYLPPRRG